MKYLLLLLLFGCTTEDTQIIWMGTGYNSFGNKYSDTVSCELLIDGGSGFVTFSKGSVIFQDTLFGVVNDGFRYTGMVRNRDTSEFMFYEFQNEINGEYGLNPDNGVYWIRHITVKR